MSFHTEHITAAPVLVHRHEIDSTQQLAADLGKDGSPHLSCVVADIQTKGRGRMGRLWVTYPEDALACSVIIRDQPQTLPLLIANVLADVLEVFCKDKMGIKWPNDILHSGKKVAGILCESFTDKAGERFYVVGTGININTPQERGDMPAIALQDIAGKAFSREEILQEYLSALFSALEVHSQEGFKAFYKDYMARCQTIGKKVRWPSAQGEKYGIASHLDETGSLVIETETGQEVCHSAALIEDL